jgi:replicative DNA helicase
MVLALDPNILDSYQGESIYNDKQKEYDMDVLNQWKKKAEKILDLRVLKNRNGRSGDTFNLLFQSSKFKFSEIV